MVNGLYLLRALSILVEEKYAFTLIYLFIHNSTMPLYKDNLDKSLYGE